MELVEGTSFLEYVRGSQAAPPDAPDALQLDESQQQRLRSALRQLVAALTTLHAAGIVHSDVKPSNLRIDRTGRLVLLDFGVAIFRSRDGEEQRQRHYVGGTRPYMAPEVLRGETPTPSADWFGVGRMMLEACLGFLPGAHRSTVSHRSASTDPLPCGADLRAMPPGVRELIRRLTAEAPADRGNGVDILRWLGDKVPASSRALQEVPPEVRFVGREAQLRGLHRALAAVRAGGTSGVFVHGLAGSGKTRLVDEFLHGLADGAEVLVLKGRCYEQEAVPYKAVDELIDALTRSLQRLHPDERRRLLPTDLAAAAKVFPVLNRLPEIAGAQQTQHTERNQASWREQAFVALRECLLNLAAEQTLILVVDDLQWGDADSAELLWELVQPGRRPPLLFIGVYRPDESATHGFLTTFAKRHATLPHRSQFSWIEVEPLSGGESLTLAAELIADNSPPPPDVIHSIAVASQGMPLLLHELAGYAGWQQTAEAGNATNTATLTVEQLIYRRVQNLSVDAREVLELIAVAGQPVPRKVLIAAVGRAVNETALLTQLRAKRLMRGVAGADDQQLVVFHDRIRETLLAATSSKRLRELHRQWLNAMELLGEDSPERLAAHVEGIGAHDRAAQLALHAARNAGEQLAFEQEASWYRKAMHLDARYAQDLALHRRLADAQMKAGLNAEAGEVLLQAAQGATGDEGFALRRQAAQQLLVAGRIDEGREVLNQVLHDLGSGLPRSKWSALAQMMLAELRCSLVRDSKPVSPAPAAIALQTSAARQRLETYWVVVHALSRCDPAASWPFFARHRLLSQRLGDEKHACLAKMLQATCLTVFQGDRKRPQAVACLDAMVDRCEATGDPYVRGYHQLCYAGVGYFLGDWGRCIEAGIVAERVYLDDCVGMHHEVSDLYMYTHQAQFMRGDLVALDRVVPQAADQSRRRGDLLGETNAQVGFAIAHLLMRDESEAALETIHQVMR
ncbi:MAG: AAA family ATPase, partial [Pirellulales bacterium]